MQYLRRTSSVLFSSVLAAASRFYRHDLHSVLLSHAQTVLDRALLAGSTDIGVIQSLMILTYWKEPEDTSGWMKVGMALRLGYSLFWHIPRTSSLPQNEMEARKLLNAERTWLCECNLCSSSTNVQVCSVGGSGGSSLTTPTSFRPRVCDFDCRC